MFAYTCVCKDAFSGFNCQVDVNDCASSPCKNGGVCTDATDAYTCTCKRSWSGAVCDVEVDPCAKKEDDCDANKAECIQTGAGPSQPSLHSRILILLARVVKGPSAISSHFQPDLSGPVGTALLTFACLGFPSRRLAQVRVQPWLLLYQQW